MNGIINQFCSEQWCIVSGKKCIQKQLFFYKQMIKRKGKQMTKKRTDTTINSIICCENFFVSKGCFFYACLCNKVFFTYKLSSFSASVTKFRISDACGQYFEMLCTNANVERAPNNPNKRLFKPFNKHCSTAAAKSYVYSKELKMCFSSWALCLGGNEVKQKGQTKRVRRAGREEREERMEHRRNMQSRFVPIAHVIIH